MRGVARATGGRLVPQKPRKVKALAREARVNKRGV